MADSFMGGKLSLLIRCGFKIDERLENVANDDVSLGAHSAHGWWFYVRQRQHGHMPTEQGLHRTYVQCVEELSDNEYIRVLPSLHYIA